MKMHPNAGAPTTRIAALFVALQLCTQTVDAGKWVSPNGKEPAAPSVIAQPQAALGAKKSVMLTIEFPGFYQGSSTNKNTAYETIRIPTCGSHRDLGAPGVPVKIVPIKIPYGFDYDVKVTGGNFIEIQNVNLVPSQPPEPNIDRSSKQPFYKNAELYARDAWFPDSNVVSSSIVTLRSQQFLELSVTPVRFHPVNGQIQFAMTLELLIEVSPRDTEESQEQLPKASYDQLIGDGVFSFIEGATARTEPDPEKYMIIYDEQFHHNATLQEFVDWKRRKGYDVVLVSTTTIEPINGAPTWEQTREYLQGLPAADYPVYLLLLGDHRLDMGVQGFEFSTSSGDDDNYVGYSDLQFSHRNNNDLEPDLFCGRLPVSDNDQLTAAMSKVMAMDRCPPSDGMYSKVLVAGQIQDCEPPKHVADRLFCETADAIASYFEYANSGQYDCHRAIVNPNNMKSGDRFKADGILWNGQIIGERVHRHFVGGRVATQRIAHLIDSGVAIVQHRDHGSYTGWVHPAFDSQDVESLKNDVKTTAVFSLDCFTGCYMYGDESFVKKWLTGSSGGAYVVFAATDRSYSRPNDCLNHGFYVSFLPDYVNFIRQSSDPDWELELPDPSYFDAGSGTRLGHILNFGKFYLREQGELDPETYLLYHCFGDPESFIRLHQPTAMSVTHPASVSVAETEIAVEAPLGALVCLYNQEMDLHLARTATETPTVFDVSLPQTGSVSVTVSKYDHRPYEGSIEVVSP